MQICRVGFFLIIRIYSGSGIFLATNLICNTSMCQKTRLAPVEIFFCQNHKRNWKRRDERHFLIAHVWNLRKKTFLTEKFFFGSWRKKIVHSNSIALLVVSSSHFALHIPIREILIEKVINRKIFNYKMKNNSFFIPFSVPSFSLPQHEKLH